MDSPSQNTRNRSGMAYSNPEAARPTAVQPASRKTPKARTATAVDRKLAQAVVTCTGVLWLVAIFVGLITHTGKLLISCQLRSVHHHSVALEAFCAGTAWIDAVFLLACRPPA